MQLHEKQGTITVFLCLFFSTANLSRCQSVSLTLLILPSSCTPGSQRESPPCGTSSTCSPPQAGWAYFFQWQLFSFSARYLYSLDQSLGLRQIKTILFSSHLGNEANVKLLYAMCKYLTFFSISLSIVPEQSGLFSLGFSFKSVFLIWAITGGFLRWKIYILNYTAAIR